MRLRSANLAGVTVFRLCLSSNTQLVVKSRQRLQSNLRRRTNNLQALAHIKAESRHKTSIHIHKCMGCLVEPIIQRHRREIVVLRQHKEVYGTYRAVNTPQLQCCVFGLRFWLWRRTQMATRAQVTGYWGIKCIGSVVRLGVSIIMTSRSSKIDDR